MGFFPFLVRFFSKYSMSKSMLISWQSRLVGWSAGPTLMGIAPKICWDIMGYTNHVDVIWVSKNAGHPPNGYFFPRG
jgi:hypothetical protein